MLNIEWMGQSTTGEELIPRTVVVHQLVDSVAADRDYHRPRVALKWSEFNEASGGLESDICG